MGGRGCFTGTGPLDIVSYLWMGPGRGRGSESKVTSTLPSTWTSESTLTSCDYSTSWCRHFRLRVPSAPVASVLRAGLGSRPRPEVLQARPVSSQHGQTHHDRPRLDLWTRLPSDRGLRGCLGPRAPVLYTPLGKCNEGGGSRTTSTVLRFSFAGSFRHGRFPGSRVLPPRTPVGTGSTDEEEKENPFSHDGCGRGPVFGLVTGTD